jgi:tetraacyldisaccharide 4'-kinase
LIRGYKRERGPDAIVIPPKPGRAPEPREVGDEAGWLARLFPQVPIGVSAERFRTGELIGANYPVDVFVLDDGFQHLALARKLDVVALDATREISDRELLPAGLQREPCSALARAGLVVITRTELADPAPLEAKVRTINSTAPVVRAQTRLERLVTAGGATVAPDEFLGRPVHAFCGIGNPDAFFRNLRSWGFDVVRESVFPDHHAYRNLAFARGGSMAALLTTEKDLMNLVGLDMGSVGAPVLACATRFELADAAAFEKTLFRSLEDPGRETENRN